MDLSVLRKQAFILNKERIKMSHTINLAFYFNDVEGDEVMLEVEASITKNNVSDYSQPQIEDLSIRFAGKEITLTEAIEMGVNKNELYNEIVEMAFLDEADDITDFDSEQY